MQMALQKVMLRAALRARRRQASLVDGWVTQVGRIGFDNVG
jgi:hypothetical protein